MKRLEIGVWHGMAILMLIFSVSGRAFGAEADRTLSDSSALSKVSSSWQDQLKDQLSREDDMEGHAGLSEKVDAAMEKLMREINKESRAHASHTGATGPFSDLGAMQQMDRSFFLGPSPAGESVTQGGHCPAGAPVKAYDVSAINVEITLNQWPDYHPGYMYALTE